jgi:type II secretory pathway component HofQ
VASAILNDVPADVGSWAIAAMLVTGPTLETLDAFEGVVSAPSSRRIDIELQDADLREVLRLFADIGHVNIVVQRGIQGRVTCRFRDTPWDEILRHIVRATGHALIREGNVYYVKRRED